MRRMLIKNLLQLLTRNCCLFYDESSEDNLNQLQYRSFCRRVSTSSIAITPESLPPTSNASKFHSYRAHHQVQVWRGREDIDPLLWGWKIDKSKLMPIAMNQSPAPSELLKIVRVLVRQVAKIRDVLVSNMGWNAQTLAVNVVVFRAWIARKLHLKSMMKRMMTILFLE